MTAQSLSKKSRDELNNSINILYRKFINKSDPGSKDKNSPATDDASDLEDEENENHLSAAVGIGI